MAAHVENVDAKKDCHEKIPYKMGKMEICI